MIKIDSIRDFIKNNLVGEGLEIGASHCPLPYNSATTHITYQDRLNLEDRKAEVALYDKNVDVNTLINPDVVSDAECVPFMDSSFDFVCNSHLFEHLKNPVKALLEWIRVTKCGGYIYMIVPDKRYTFDKHRDITNYFHMLRDYTRDVQEICLSHYLDNAGIEEELDVDKKVFDEYIKQTNIHVHTFTDESLKELLEAVKQFRDYFDIIDMIREDMNIAVLLQVRC